MFVDLAPVREPRLVALELREACGRGARELLLEYLRARSCWCWTTSSICLKPRPCCRVLDPLRRLRWHRLPPRLGHLHRAVQPLHPMRRLGGDLHPRGPAEEHVDLQPTTVYGDTLAQSTPVFGLAHLLGIKLMPRIRNWKDLTFFRPSKDTRRKHIDALFTETVDWELIENPLAGPASGRALGQSQRGVVGAAVAQAGSPQPAQSPLSGLRRTRPRHSDRVPAGVLEQRPTPRADHREHERGRGLPPLRQMALLRRRGPAVGNPW